MRLLRLGSKRVEKLTALFLLSLFSLFFAVIFIAVARPDVFSTIIQDLIFNIVLQTSTTTVDRYRETADNITFQTLDMQSLSSVYNPLGSDEVTFSTSHSQGVSSDYSGSDSDSMNMTVVDAQQLGYTESGSDSINMTSVHAQNLGYAGAPLDSMNVTISVDTTLANQFPRIWGYEAPANTYNDTYFLLNATVRDPEGRATLNNASVEITGGVVLFWDNATDAFSISADPNSYASIDGSTSSSSVIDDYSYELTWNITLENACPQGPKDVVASGTEAGDGSGATYNGAGASALFLYEALGASVTDSFNMTYTLPTTVSGIDYYRETSFAFNMTQTEGETVSGSTNYYYPEFQFNMTSTLPVTISGEYAATTFSDTITLLTVDNTRVSGTYAATSAWDEIELSRELSQATVSGTVNPATGSADFTLTTLDTQSVAPTFDSAAATALAKGNTSFLVSATVSSPTGVADLSSARVEINGSIVLQWTAPDTFSELADPSGYCTVNGGTKTQIGAYQYRLSWNITLTDSYPEGTIALLADGNTSVTDGFGNTANGTADASFFYYTTYTGWGKGGWAMRKPLIFEGTGAALTSLQVEMNLTYVTGMQTGFEELRFTQLDDTANTEAELDYWIESQSDGAWVDVWVEVPTISADGFTPLYMYYNKTATTTSSGSGTFLLFDDFGDGSFDTALWNKTEEASLTVTETGGELKMSGTSTSSEWNITEAYTDLSYTTPWVMEARMRMGLTLNTSQGRDMWMGTSGANGNQFFGPHQDASIAYSDTFASLDTSKWTLYDNAYYDSGNQWVRLTQNAGSLRGMLEYDPGISATSWTLNGNFYKSGGADHWGLSFYADAIGKGSGNTWFPTDGYTVTYDEYNSLIKLYEHVSGSETILASTAQSIADGNHVYNVTYSGGNVLVYYDSSLKINYNIGSPSYTYSKFYFQARTGGVSAEHRVLDMDLQGVGSSSSTYLYSTGTLEGGSTSIENAAAYYLNYTWYWLEALTDSVKFYKDGAFKKNVTTSPGATAYARLKSRTKNVGDDIDNRIDVVFVRKYEASAPSYTFGAVESGAGNLAPTIGGFEAPATVYANKYFLVNATVDDQDGFAEFVNATVELTGGVVLKWDNATDVFSEYADPSGYCTLDAGGSSRANLNSTAHRLTFLVKMNWTYPEGSIDVVSGSTKVEDASGSGSGSESGLFTFEDDLIISSAMVDDGRVNPGDTVTFNGTLYYQGTSEVPEDLNGITAYVALSGVAKNSSTSIDGSGEFSIQVSAESSVAQHGYNVYAVTDSPSVQNQTVNVVVDRVKVHYFTVDDSRVSVGSGVEVRVKAVLEYDESALGSGDSFEVNGTALAWDSGNGWFDGPFTEAQGNRTFAFTSVGEATYGITSYTTNVSAPWAVWDRFEITSVAFDDDHVNVGGASEIRYQIRWDFDDVAFTGSNGTISGFTWDGGNSWWDKAVTAPASPGEENYDETDLGSITDSVYGITVLMDVAGANLTGNRIQITGMGVVDGRVDVNTVATFWATAQLEYGGHALGSSDTLNISDVGMTWDGGDSRFEGNASKATVQQAAYDSFTSGSEATNGITSGNMDSTSATITWDQIEVFLVAFNDSRVNIGAAAEVRFTIRWDYDDVAFTGDNGSIVGWTWDAGNGWWDKAVTAPASPGEENYDENDLGSITDSVYGITVLKDVAGLGLTGDRVKVYYIAVNDSRVDVDGGVEVRVKAVLEYDETPLGTGDTVDVNGTTLTWDSGNSWLDEALTEASVGNWTFSVTGASETGSGITVYTTNFSAPWAVWDRLEIAAVTFDDDYVDIGATAEVRYQIRWDYDDEAFTGDNGSISGFTYNSGNGRWEKNVTAPASPGLENYDENDLGSITDSVYGITGLEDDVGSDLTGNRIQITGMGVVDGRVNAGANATIWATAQLEAGSHALGSGDSLILGGVALTWDSGDSRFEGNVLKSSAQQADYTAYTSGSEATYGITAGNMDSQNASAIWDALKCTSFTRDVANQRVYVRMLYAYDSTAAENGTVSFAGETGTSNSTGWALVDLTSAGNFDWGIEAYGSTDDLYGITTTSQNQTVTLAKYGKVIGGDAALSTGTWDGTTLNLDFALTTGTYSTEITATSAPSYVVNATYDTDTDLSGGVLTLSHDSTEDLRAVWESWGGLAVRGLTRGSLISVSFVDQVLTMVVDGSSGSGTLYVDCTGRTAPTRNTGFDDTYWQPSTSLWWGTYTLASNRTLTVEFGIGSGGTESGGGGGDTRVDVTLEAVTVVATQGQATVVTVPVGWTGPLILRVESIGFGDYVDWFAIDEVMPLSIAGEGPLKKGEMTFTVTPPGDLPPGNHTIPVDIQVAVQGFASIHARSLVYLTVNRRAGPQPAEGPITEAVGYVLGIGLVAAIGYALWKRD